MTQNTAGYKFLGGAFIVLLWFGLLATRPLFNPDEGRYAEIPREMLASGDWLTPRLNGLIYAEKPPLQYWITAGLFKFLGVHDWVARLWPMLAAALGLWVIAYGARRLWGAAAAPIATAVCAAAPLYLALGQLLTLDMALTFFLTTALVAFCIAQQERERRPRAGRWMAVCWLAISAAIMTKGPVALALPAITILLYSLWQRDFKVWRVSRLLSGALIVAIFAAPWFLAESQAVPGFAQFFFIHEHLLRYATMSARHYQPWWYFIPVLLIGMLPWLPQIFAALKSPLLQGASRGSFDARRLLWVWAAVVFAFYSVSDSKLIPYVLPVLPALILLVASDARHLTIRNLRVSAALTAAVALLLAVAAARPHALIHHQGTALRVLELAGQSLMAIAAVLLLASVATLLVAAKYGTLATLRTLAAGWFVAPVLLFGWTLSIAAPYYSTAPLLSALPAPPPASVPLYSIQDYEQTLPFYLGRKVELVQFRGELDFGLQREPARYLSMEQFFSNWRGAGQAFALMPSAVYESLRRDGLPMVVVGRTPAYLLVKTIR